MKPFLIIAVAVALLIGRLFVHPGTPTRVDIYKDAAHLFVGGLFIAWRIQRNRWQAILFWLMCAWEVFVSLGSRFLWTALAMCFLLSFTGCTSIKKENAAIGRTVAKANTAVDRTLRSQIQQVECPISFTLSPGLIGFTLIPRIIYRNPAAAPTALATQKGTMSQ